MKTITLDDAMYAVLESHARREGLSIEQWIAQRAAGETGSDTARRSAFEQLKSLRRELPKVSAKSLRHDIEQGRQA